MTDTSDRNIVQMENAESALREHFLGWQCRLRQMCIREAGGRPTSGMRPALNIPALNVGYGPVNVLINKSDPAHYTAEFRHMARKTHDPKERYDAALKFLAAAYYQRAREFSGELTALFGADSAVATTLLEAGACTLEFEQYNQRYEMHCVVRELSEDEPGFQATYWHNALFNSELPGVVCIVGMTPDWATTKTEPAVY